MLTVATSHERSLLSLRIGSSLEKIKIMEILKKINYLDNNSTTPIDSSVIKALPHWLEAWGNPSSIHQGGRGPKNILRESRHALAKHFKVSPLELVFTSGASEGNNSVIQGLYINNTSDRDEYMCSTVEHPSVLKAYKDIEKKGAKVHWIPVSAKGHLDEDFFETFLSEKTLLVSIMAANNETGNIFPIKDLVEKAHRVGALFHSDCVQMVGKGVFSLKDWDLDFATFSGHKFYALKGSGIIYIKTQSPFYCLIHGGGQERNRRGGTENVLAIASLGLMANKLNEEAKYIEKMTHLRNHLENRVLKKIRGVTITGVESPRICNTSHMMIPGVDGETLLMNLDLAGIQVSTGAACSSGNPEPSPVLLAMGFSRQQAQSSLRVSLGWNTNEVDIESFINTLEKVVTRLRNLK